MSGGSTEPEHPTDQRCEKCGLYWASSGIDNHEDHCDGGGESNEPDPDPRGSAQPPQQPPAQPPQQPPAQPPQQPPQAAQGGQQGGPMPGEGNPSSQQRGGQQPDAGRPGEDSGPDQCPQCGQQQLAGPGDVVADDGSVGFVVGEQRGDLQMSPDDRVCAPCGILIEGDGRTENLIPQ